jgi:hypothetical protein
MSYVGKLSLAELLVRQDGREVAVAPQEAPLVEASRPAALPRLVCRRCGGLSFADAGAYRSHFRLVHEVAGDASSSDSSDGEGERGEEDAGGGGEEAEEGGDGPVLTVILQPGLSLVRCWKALLPPSVVKEAVRGTPPLLHPEALSLVPGATWLVALYRGGYFAAVIVRVCPAEGEMAPRDADAAGHVGYPRILLHKRFARYTTRRKQGGSQRAHDSATGHAANSIGAQMRRAGEAALVDDIHGLWTSREWSAAVGRCSHVFVSASRTTVGDLWDGAVLAKGDARVRRVPMATGRPTFAEAAGVAQALAQVTLLGTAAAGTVGAAERATSDNAWTTGGGRLEAGEEEDAPRTRRERDGTGVAAARGPERSGPSKRAQRRLRLTTRRRGGGGGGEPAEEEEEEDDGGEGEAALAAGVAAADEERRRASRAEEVSASLGALSREAVQGLRSAATAVRVPVGVLARMLRAEALLTDGRGAVATAVTEALLRDVQESLSTLALLVQEEGLAPAEAFACLGWDGLAAAATVASAGLEVDWAAVAAPSAGGGAAGGPRAVKLAKGGGKKGRGQALELDPELEVPSPTPTPGGKPKGKAGGGKRGQAHAAPALVQPPPSLPARLAATDGPAMAGLADKDARRLAVRQAAEARWAVLGAQQQMQ